MQKKILCTLSYIEETIVYKEYVCCTVVQKKNNSIHVNREIIAEKNENSDSKLYILSIYILKKKFSKQCPYLN